MEVRCVRCIGFFFFFKQKTAYEIGTGDWSSDVCSSDLDLAAASDVTVRLFDVGMNLVRTIEAPGRPAGPTEIGRASCRERV